MTIKNKDCVFWGKMLLKVKHAISAPKVGSFFSRAVTLYLLVPKNLCFRLVFVCILEVVDKTPSIPHHPSVTGGNKQLPRAASFWGYQRKICAHKRDIHGSARDLW